MSRKERGLYLLSIVLDGYERSFELGGCKVDPMSKHLVEEARVAVGVRDFRRPVVSHWLLAEEKAPHATNGLPLKFDASLLGRRLKAGTQLSRYRVQPFVCARHLQ